MEMRNPTDTLIAVDKEELETEIKPYEKFELNFCDCFHYWNFFPTANLQQSISVCCPSDISKAFLAILNSFDGEQTHKISFFIQIFKYFLHC